MISRVDKIEEMLQYGTMLILIVFVIQSGNTPVDAFTFLNPLYFASESDGFAVVGNTAKVIVRNNVFKIQQRDEVDVL